MQIKLLPKLVPFLEERGFQVDHCREDDNGGAVYVDDAGRIVYAWYTPSFELECVLSDHSQRFDNAIDFAVWAHNLQPDVKKHFDPIRH